MNYAQLLKLYFVLQSENFYVPKSSLIIKVMLEKITVTLSSIEYSPCGTYLIGSTPELTDAVVFRLDHVFQTIVYKAEPKAIKMPDGNWELNGYLIGTDEDFINHMVNDNGWTGNDVVDHVMANVNAALAAS